jgi:O-antigen/teichoic acid export membrane protein
MVVVTRVLERLQGLRSSTALFGSASRVFALGSQFVVVLVLARLLPKSAFGDFMISFAAYRLLATGIGTGLASVLLYHLSRSTEDTGVLELRLHRSTLLVAALVGTAFCVAAWAGAELIAAEFAKPGLALWLRAMTPFLLFSLLGITSSGSYEGRTQVATAIFLTEVAPNALRLGLLAPLGFLPLPPIWIAHVMAVSVALPWAYSVRHLLKGHGWQRLTRWDYAYAGRLSIYNFAALQVQGVDMIVAGWLFPSQAVADYAIASRIGALFPFFLQLRVRMFGPLAGQMLGRGDREGLQAEILVAKRFATVLVTLTVAGLLLATPIFLRLFWSSSTLASLLVLFAFPPVYRSLFAAGDRLLQLGGHADWNMRIQLAALTIVVGLPVLVGRWLGVASLPVAMTVSGFLLNPVIAYGVRRLTGVELLQRGDLAVMAVAAASVVIPIAFTSGVATVLWSGAMFLLLGAALLWLNRTSLRKTQ